MSNAQNGTSFIDSINDRGSEETRYINHIMRQGLIQFIALDYAILDYVRTLRKDIPSIDKPYLLGNGNSQVSIGLPMLASLELESLFDITKQNHQAEISKFKNLAKILYRINAQKFDWIYLKDEDWITTPCSTIVKTDCSKIELECPVEIKIVSNEKYVRPQNDSPAYLKRMAISIYYVSSDPKIRIAKEKKNINRSLAGGTSSTSGIPDWLVTDYIIIPLQEKDKNSKRYAFTVEIFDDMTIATAYTKYRIAQLLQSIWAYSLLYPTVFLELSPNYKDIRQREDNYPEQSDPRFLKGVEEAKKNTRLLDFLNFLENANLGIPLQDEVKEVLKNIVLRIGNLPVPTPTGSMYIDIPVSDPKYDDYEDNNELNILVHLLLFSDRIELFKQILPLPPNVDDLTDDVNELIRATGLEDIFHQLFDLVQDDSSGGFNIEVFNSIRDIWGHLFSLSSGTPDGINFIEKQLPSIEGAFSTIIPAQSQQDHFAGELDHVMDFLSRALRQERLVDLRNVLNSPSPSMFINTFRSLRGLDPEVLEPPAEIGIPEKKDFWREFDDDNWFDYLFLIWWILTFEQKFSEIAKFAFIVSDRDKFPDKVIFDAMFPGGLGGPSVVLAAGPSQLIDQSNSSARLELEYATYERNLSSLDNQLRKPGGLIRLARSYGGLSI